MNNKIGTKIKELREFLRISQSDFAKQIGVAQANLSTIEQGETNPSVAVIYRIIEAFPELNLDWLLKNKGGNVFTRKQDVEKQAEEISFVKKENEYLKEILHLLKEKLNSTKKMLALTHSVSPVQSQINY